MGTGQPCRRVVVLLDSGLSQARHQCHNHPSKGSVLPLFIGKGGAECLGILEPQLENVTDLNAAARLRLLAGVMTTTITGQG